MSDKSIEAGKWQMHSQRWPDSCGCFADLLWIENPQNPTPLSPPQSRRIPAAISISMIRFRRNWPELNWKANDKNMKLIFLLFRSIFEPEIGTLLFSSNDI